PALHLSPMERKSRTGPGCIYSSGWMQHRLSTVPTEYCTDWIQQRLNAAPAEYSTDRVQHGQQTTADKTL
ncbi:MAG: hypothetical protein SPE66_02265, partial [Bilifractor sp.]|nr:hypothetical protein [Bilifractor sp.]